LFIFVLAMLIYTLYLLLKGTTSKEDFRLLLTILLLQDNITILQEYLVKLFYPLFNSLELFSGWWIWGLGFHIKIFVNDTYFYSFYLVGYEIGCLRERKNIHTKTYLIYVKNHRQSKRNIRKTKTAEN